MRKSLKLWGFVLLFLVVILFQGCSSGGDTNTDKENAEFYSADYIHREHNFFEWGIFNNIDMNKGGAVVDVHRSLSRDDLWCRLGFVRSPVILWFDSIKYDTGTGPDVSVNNNGLVVEVHKAEKNTGLWYNLGIIDMAGKKVDWTYKVKNHFGNGWNPKVAVNSNGTVVEVHRGESTHNLWYRIGKVQFDKQGKPNGIKWLHNENYDTGNFPDISINDSGKVLEVHTSQHESKLYYRVGQIINENRIDWISGKKGVPMTNGAGASVDMDNSGKFVAAFNKSYSAGLNDGSKIYYLRGNVVENVAQYSDPQEFYVSGITPSASIRDTADPDPNMAMTYSRLNGNAPSSDKGNHFIHDVLCFASNNIQPASERWVELLFKPNGDIPLYKMTFPASHDSGTYKIDLPAFAQCQELDIKKQLKSGIRYFDLRFFHSEYDMSSHEFVIHHDFIITDITLDDIMDDVNDFLKDAPQEVVILNISHFDGEPGFSNKSHKNFVESLVKKLSAHFPDPSIIKPSGMLNLTYNQITSKGKSAVLIIYRSDYARDNSTELVNMGIIPGDYFPVYDSYSNTSHYDKMRSDQLSKLKKHEGNPDKLFLLSWTLTALHGNMDSVDHMAYVANSHFDKNFEEILQNQSNFLYHDFAGVVGGADFTKSAVYYVLKRNKLEISPE